MQRCKLHKSECFSCRFDFLKKKVITCKRTFWNVLTIYDITLYAFSFFHFSSLTHPLVSVFKCLSRPLQMCSLSAARSAITRNIYQSLLSFDWRYLMQDSEIRAHCKNFSTDILKKYLVPLLEKDCLLWLYGNRWYDFYKLTCFLLLKISHSHSSLAAYYQSNSFNQPQLINIVRRRTKKLLKKSTEQILSRFCVNTNCNITSTHYICFFQFCCTDSETHLVHVLK